MSKEVMKRKIKERKEELRNCSEGLATMIMKSTIFWNVAPYSLVEFYLRVCECLLVCTALYHRRYYSSRIKKNSTPLSRMEGRESGRCNYILVYRNASIRILVSYDFNTQNQRMFERGGAWLMSSLLSATKSSQPTCQVALPLPTISLVLPSISCFSSWPIFSCSTVLPTRHS